MTKWTNRKFGAAISLSVLATGLLATTSTLRAQESDAAKDDTAATRHFKGAADTETCLKEAAKMNLGTIQFAQLAAQKAESSELKRFGQTLEQDHKKAQAELETIAKKHNVTLPTSPDPKCEEELAKLRGYSGQDFDKEFAKGAVEGHAMALAHLQQASTSTEIKDADVKQYIGKITERMKNHQRRARQVAMAVGVDDSTIASLENKGREAVGTPGAGTETSTETSPSKNNPTRDSDPK
jgi:putative membrane protein